MFKGFTKDMKCRDFQYEEGKTYEEPEARFCDKGFHACEDPIDCLNYYAPAESKFHEVDLDEVSDERSSEDSKRVGRRITIGAEINFMNIAKAHIEYVNEKVTEAVERGDAEAISVGDYQKATVGNRGVANAGNRGVAVSRGSSKSGENGISVVRGDNVKAKGELGALLVVAEEYECNYAIKSYAVGIVDGEIIKADTWYKCVDGKLVEVQ